MAPWHRPWIAPWLAFVAGNVDAMGYVFLGEVFTSNMTGNISALGVSLVVPQLHARLMRGLAIVPFVAGVVFGTFVVETGDGGRRRVAAALLLEMALLALYVGLAAPSLIPHGALLYAGLALFPLAMGIQNAMLLRPDGTVLPTTHITGALTNFALDLARRLRRRGPEYARPGAGAIARHGLRWLAFGVGAVTGSLLWDSVHALAPLVPVALLAPLVALDLHAPLARG